jgi:hypothetical protein
MPYVFKYREDRNDFAETVRVNFWRGHLIEVYRPDIARDLIRVYPCYCTRDLTTDRVCINHATWFDILLGRTRRSFL